MTGDLTEGRPGGAGWMDEFQEQGMPEPLVRLLSSCFDKPQRRPADAGVICERLRDYLRPVSTLRPDPEPPQKPRVETTKPGSARGWVDEAASPPKPVEAARVGELCRFNGHTDVVECVAFSPDGTRA